MNAVPMLIVAKNLGHTDTRHDANGPLCPLMTQSGHMPGAGYPVPDLP